jgi:hypothetical protein
LDDIGKKVPLNIQDAIIFWRKRRQRKREYFFKRKLLVKMKKKYNPYFDRQKKDIHFDALINE